MLIRDLKWNDFEDLMENYYSFYDEVKENPAFGIVLRVKKPTREEEVTWFTQLFKEMLEGNAVVSVGEVDGGVVGMCEVTRLASGTEKSHVGGLGISVKKEYRGRGIGYTLMEDCLRKCKNNFEMITLEVFTVNEAAKRLYTKLGFKTCGILPKSVKRDNRYLDEEMMYLNLKDLR